MSFKKVFFRNIFISGGYTFLAQFLSFLASLITSRLLSPGDFGLVGLITVFSGFISVFSDSGITMAVIRSEYRDTYYRGLNTVSILIGIFLCFLFILLIYPISLFYKNQDLLLPGIAISFLFIIRSVNVVPTAVLQKRLAFGVAGKALFFGVFASTISAIVMAYSGFTYWSLIWSQYIASIVTGLIIFSKTGFINPFVSKPVLFKSFYLAKALIGSIMGFNMINYWARNADNLIVGKYYSTNDLGIYSRAYLMLMMPLTVITAIFSSVMYPSLIKHKSEGGNVEKEYYFMLKVISFINIPIALVLILFPIQFVSILWGNNWLAVAQLLPYFGLLVLTQTLVSTLASIMVMHKLEKHLMYTGWINAVFMVSGIVFGATISLTAIAAFYSLSYILLVLPLYIFYLFNYKLRTNASVLGFWLPKLFLSAFIWVGIYFSVFQIILVGLVVWIALIFWDARKELSAIQARLLPKPSKAL